MGCQPSRLVFTGLPFEASRPEREAPCYISDRTRPPAQPASPSVLPCTHSQVGLPPSSADGGGGG